MGIVWKRIYGHEKYFVSNKGDVKNEERGLLKQTISSGKRYVKLHKVGKGYKSVGVHQLVANAFLKKEKGKIDFKNGDTLDCRAENLYYNANNSSCIEYYKDNPVLPSNFKVKCKSKGWNYNDFFMVVAGKNKHGQKICYFIHKNLLFVDKI